ncbi:MAG: DNA gyrase [Lachnospiraceae bacterium]|nr:DNA gyrase [Lachnospiraceae bacterium]
MDAITRQTRKASYDAVLPKVKERSRLILETLGDRKMTVSEITDELVAAHRIPYYNRNYVAPRLSELKDMGIVETCGRKKSTRSTATEAVWRRKEPQS